MDSELLMMGVDNSLDNITTHWEEFEKDRGNFKSIEDFIIHSVKNQIDNNLKFLTAQGILEFKKPNHERKNK